MSKIIASAAIRGAHKYVAEAEQKLKEAIETYKPEKKVAFPNTAYHLPLILALLGLKVETLKDCQEALKYAQELLPPLPEEQLWLPYLGDALDAGIATLIAEEIIEALRYLDPSYKPEPPWLGFTDDTILRTQGIKLVDGRMPGFAACVGALPTNRDAVELARALQERNILVFMAGDSNGRSMAEQLADEGIEMSWDTFLVPYGKPVSAAVFALNFAARAAMTFGGIKPGSFDAARKILLYNKERVFAFVLALGADPGVNGTGQLLTDEKYATAAGAINFGFPVIADVPIPQILPRGICTYEHVVSGVSLDKIVQKAIEVRGLKIKISKIPIPVPYGAGFEGERVRKENLYVEFGGRYSTAFELLRARPMDEVEDGKIELIGPDIDQAQEGGAMPLGVIVDVAGRNLKPDFEPVLERRIHHFISCINGVMHIGQRDIPWVRISKEAYEKGFRLKHYGEVLVAKFKEDFGALVDKVQVKIVTDQAQVEALLKEAREIYRARDERVMGLKDEDVDTFYSCILCVPKGEEIVLADGSFVPVEKLIEQAVESDGVKVLSWDGCSLRPKPVEELFINPAPAELLRITLENGNALTLTPNHKVLVDRDDLEWVPAQELKVGDGLVTARTTYLNGAEPEETLHILDVLPDDLLVQDEGFLAELRKILLQRFGSWAKAARALKLPYHRLYAAFYQSPNPRVHPCRLTLAEIKKICSILGLSWHEAKTRIRRLGTQGGSIIKKQALDEDLLYAAGLVAADGCVVRRGRGTSLQFTNTEPALIERFNRIMAEAFDTRPRVYRVPPYESRSRDGELVIRGRREVLVSRINNQLAGPLMNGLGIGRDSQRREKWSGEVISKLPPQLIAAFLRGLFDGDGHVTKGRVLITTRSFKEAQHIVLLLKKLGINAYISRIQRGFQVATKRSTDFLTWRQKIGSEHPAKRTKLEATPTVRDAKHVSRTDVLPRRCGRLLRKIFVEANGQLQITKLPVDYKSLRAWISGRVRPSREKLQAVTEALRSQVDQHLPAMQELWDWCNSAVHIEKIKQVERIKNMDRAVYNFSVSDTHNYLVNGVVVKNCQSYAPNHVCIVTPQRLGLCGAYTWLDCGASYEMDPHGPNKPVPKGVCLDPVLGEWQGVNEYVRVASNGNLERVSMYSIMQNPQTSCGCFECIVAVLPECNGVMVVNREFNGMTPIGMTFSTMAGEVGGGVQTPGFLGVGKLYLTSEKFISAEGGIKRLVWMPSELKEEIKERLQKRLEEIGMPELFDKIATEKDATTSEELLEFLQRVGHPALEMEPIVQ
jgi:acetyl-CoA synthase